MFNHPNTLAFAPITSPTTLEEVRQELMTFFASPRKTVSDALTSIVLGGGVEVLTHSVLALPVFRIDQLSGYNYSFQNKMLAEIRFGITRSGLFVIQTSVAGKTPEELKSVNSHYFNESGKFVFSEFAYAQPLVECKAELMDARCPVLNHIYNILSQEYASAKEGTANTKRAHTLEVFLRRIAHLRKDEVAVNHGIRDEAIVALTQKIMTTDLDPVLTWKERYAIFKAIKLERSGVLDTKRRAHHKNYFFYQFPIHLQDFVKATERFFKRPYNNLIGTLDRIFIDPIRWFFRVVRNNMGYSIALGIYSPFTYFFITQPMNPHATWAVGKVRTAYIETTDKVKNLFGGETTINGNTVSFYQAPQTAITGAVAAVLPVAAANANINTNGNANGANTVAPVQNTNVNVQPVEAPKTAPSPTSFIDRIKKPFTKLFGGDDNAYARLSPTNAGILMSSDVVPVNEQSWDDRMSNFKAMQISYEENLEVAPRLGRLEQMETQLNWPLIVESTWLETERYLDQIKAIEASAHEYTPSFLKYVASEKDRTNQMQFYLWDRNIRFILDHPYTMMDQSKEQTQLDYYVGRSYVLLKDMTKTLRTKTSVLALPKGYDLIEKMGDHFQADYKSNGGIFDRLKNNSQLFAQKDAMDTKELRKYMKRQWEILYLLQNRAQEPANFGLQLYNWSIRNAVWITQSIISAKREELMLIQPLFKKNANFAAVNNSSLMEHVKRIDSQYESLFHMMVLEYTSIRKEIGENLKKDIEATQRRTIIGSVESFLKERETLLKEIKVL